MSFDEKVIEVGGLKVGLRIWGENSPHKLIALHGWLDNAGSFDYLSPLLNGFQVYAIDFPGHGNSDHQPPGVAYHFVDTVYFLTQLLNQLAWPQVTLVGHSMGAGVASLYAGTFPERVERLVLIEGLGPLAYPASEAPLRLARSVLQQLELPSKKLPDYSSIEQAIAVRVKASGFSESAARPIVERGLKAVGDGYTWKTDRRLTTESPLRMTEEQVESFLRRISAPTLLIRALEGMPDSVLPWSSRRSCIKNCQYVELKGNHHLHLECPSEVAKVMIPFLRA